MYSSQIPAQSADTRLEGRWLTTTRLGAIVLMVLTMAAFLALLPAYVSALSTVCSSGACPDGQLTPALVHALEASGVSVEAYVVSTLILTLVSLLMCLSVAAVLFWRKSDDWMALLVALMLVLMGTTYVTHLLLQCHSPWQVPALFLSTLAFGALFLVFSLFPTGQFVPSWIGWLPVGWIAWGVAITFWHDAPGFYQLYVLALLGALLGIVGAQTYRYHRVSTVLQRQQTKWVVLGASAAMVAVVVVALPMVLFPSLVQPNWLYHMLVVPTYTLAIFLGSLSIGLAILRSRLWDIDRLINRTLVYGTLTGTLALIYAGLVIALHFLLRGLLSQTNDIVIVASTLAIAALFQPLRRHIQATIDRRFYRCRYDATQTLAAFSETLRSEFDLHQVRQQLVAVVQETMQPAHISLWLLQPRRHDAGKTLVLPEIGDGRG